MLREIGSNFWKEDFLEIKENQVNLSHLNLNIADTAFLSTGRSAISFILKHIESADERKIAMLPLFVCHTVIEPFLDAGYKVYFYRITRELSSKRDCFTKDLKEIAPSIVLVNGYFGFNTLKEIKDAILDIRETGIIVIEDITHTLYSKFEHVNADYYICSFRKWAGLPDGGSAISTRKIFINKPYKIDRKLLEIKTKALKAKYEYMILGNGDKEKILRMFDDAEKVLCKQQSIYAMSPISLKIQANINLTVLMNRRRKNFSRLLEKLLNSNIVEPVFKSLAKDVTPLYFPVYVKCCRKDLQNYLAKNNIYCPVIWPKPTQCKDVVDSIADWIYDHILCIPCDQRYDYSDMNRIVKVLNNYDS